MFHTLLIFDNFAIKQILFYFELTVIQKNYMEKTPHTSALQSKNMAYDLGKILYFAAMPRSGILNVPVWHGFFKSMHYAYDIEIKLLGNSSSQCKNHTNPNTAFIIIIV